MLLRQICCVYKLFTGSFFCTGSGSVLVKYRNNDVEADSFGLEIMYRNRVSRC